MNFEMPNWKLWRKRW